MIYFYINSTDNQKVYFKKCFQFSKFRLNFLLIDLKKKTIDEPAEITNHVNNVASNADKTGL